MALPTSWPSDRDYDEAHGNGADRRPAPRMAPSAREASLRRLESADSPAVRAMAASLRKLDPTPGPVCPHGIDQAASGCGRCLEQALSAEGVL